MLDYENFNEVHQRNAVERENKRIYPFLCVFFALLVIFAGCFIYFKTNFGFIDVYGKSMQYTINPNPKYVLTNAATNEWNDVQDSVLVQYNAQCKFDDIAIIKIEGRKRTIIKRVLALGGDKVTIKLDNGQYRVFVIRAGETEAEPLEDKHVNSFTGWTGSIPAVNIAVGNSTVHYEGWFFTQFLGHIDEDADTAVVDNGNGVTLIGDTYYYTIPYGHIYFMGDNRANSADSRVFGTVEHGQVVGVVRAILRDTYTAGQKGTLWWEQLKGAFSYFFNEILGFFAWNG